MIFISVRFVDIKLMTLNINVKRGQVEKSSELIGSMDSFVDLKLTSGGRTQEARTKTVKSQPKVDITWNESFQFRINPADLSNARLDLSIQDEDMTTNDLNGAGCSNMQNCLMFQKGSHNYKMSLWDETKPKEGKEKLQAGVVYFTTSYN